MTTAQREFAERRVVRSARRQLAAHEGHRLDGEGRWRRGHDKGGQGRGERPPRAGRGAAARAPQGQVSDERPGVEGDARRDQARDERPVERLKMVTVGARANPEDAGRRAKATHGPQREAERWHARGRPGHGVRDSRQARHG